MDYSGQSLKPSVRNKDEYAGAKIAPPKERIVDGIKELLRGLANSTAENTRQLEAIAGRLGYHAPKTDQKDPHPVANGHLEELAEMIRNINAAASESADYLDAIERQV